MKTTATFVSGYGLGEKQEREVTVGKRYRVEEQKPQKKKYSGRVCVVESISQQFMGRDATVRFEDNNRTGKVDMSDLIPVQDNEEEQPSA